MFTYIALFFFCFFSLPLSALNITHDAKRQSWVESANDPSSHFPLQNLPYGIFKKTGLLESEPRIAIAIGNSVIDIKGCIEEGLLETLSPSCRYALSSHSLNAFMALGKQEWSKVRFAISELLKKENGVLRDDLRLRKKLLFLQTEVELLMPVTIGDYTDFYASLNHAKHVGSMLRPATPLMPNYKHMPIGYHGRASSIVISPSITKWPKGQFLTESNMPKMDFSKSVDYELEMGAFIGPGNALGSPIKLQDAKDHIFGFVLVNDWSARDVQKWEYQPLGPFNGKNFATTISPWIVTLEALEPFTTFASPRGEEDPPLLHYLAKDSPSSAFDIILEAYLSSEKMRKQEIPPFLVSTGNLCSLYWSFDQMVCHHTVSGCNLRSGDLIASGTVSGTEKNSLGCLLERMALSLDPLLLPDGTTRKFLQDGDEVIFRAYSQKENYPKIGFGECRGMLKKIEKENNPTAI